MKRKEKEGRGNNRATEDKEGKYFWIEKGRKEKLKYGKRKGEITEKRRIGE